MNGFQFCLEYHSKRFNTTVAEKRTVFEFWKGEICVTSGEGKTSQQ